MTQRVRRISKRITNEYRTGGFRAIAVMVTSYARWRRGLRRPTVPAAEAPVVPTTAKPLPDELDDAESEASLADYAQHYHEAFTSLRPLVAGPPTLFSVVVPVHDTEPRFLEECAHSVFRQTHQAWELVLVDDASTREDTRAMLEALEQRPNVVVVRSAVNVGISAASMLGVDTAEGEYIAFLDHDDLLVETALEWAAACTPDADIIYTDSDKVDEAGNLREAFFKPAWSPRLLLAVNYVNHLTCVRRSLLAETGGLRTGFEGSQDHDLLLRLAEREPTVAHIPHVLYHWRAWSGSAAGGAEKPEASRAGLQAVSEAVDRRRWPATVTLSNAARYRYRVGWDGLEQSVTVVIPTRDRADLLEVVLTGLEKTEGADLSVVIVDNGSTDEATLRLLDAAQSRAHVEVIERPGEFNFSYLCNQGAAEGPEREFILFLNNDVAIGDARWLRQLAGWFVDPDVIGVGPKLLRPDGRIEHGGIVVGLRGRAGHYGLGLADTPRFGMFHDNAREVAAVSGACLLVRAAAFADVGGFDEGLPVDYQDVDLCLRLRHSMGGVIMYDPTYPLHHVGSASRGKVGADSAETLVAFRDRWSGEIEQGDPYYSPHLTRVAHDASPGEIPDEVAARRARLQPRWTGRPSS